MRVVYFSGAEMGKHVIFSREPTLQNVRADGLETRFHMSNQNLSEESRNKIHILFHKMTLVTKT